MLFTVDAPAVIDPEAKVLSTGTGYDSAITVLPATCLMTSSRSSCRWLGGEAHADITSPELLLTPSWAKVAHWPSIVLIVMEESAKSVICHAWLAEPEQSCSCGDEQALAK